MTQPERLADPHSGLCQQSEQEPVPQVLTRSQDLPQFLDAQRLCSRRETRSLTGRVPIARPVVTWSKNGSQVPSDTRRHATRSAAATTPKRA